MNTPVLLPDSSADDLSALAWVFDELRRSLDNAHKALRRHLKEASALRGSDVDAVDPSVLRSARVQLHQGVGALELVSLPAPAQVLRGSEAAVARLLAKPELVNASAVETIERASFALMDYLGRVLAGKTLSPLALFPQYRAVQELAGAERIHPADLWAHDWQWRALPADASAVARAADAAARGSFEAEVLALMRGPDRATLARLSDLCAGLGAGAQGREASSWQLAAAMFEAQAQELLRVDVHSKRAASRLLAQLRAQAKSGAAAEVSERLARDLLFFCAQARPLDPALETQRPAPRLLAVQQAYALDDVARVDYEQARLGRFDPAWIAQARKRVASAKEAWSALAGGEIQRASGLNEAFALVGESLGRLFKDGAILGEAMQNAVAGAGSEPAPELAMEVATSLMYVEAALEEGDFDAPELPHLVHALGQAAQALRHSRSKPGWKSCTAASVTARRWAAWCRNCAWP
jgi:chemosensory pili system protein ChpA (sensor histidine kinase/response regulator)